MNVPSACKIGPPPQQREAMSALEQLQLLSLVQKVCQELDTHVGINDKDLAEFIIEMADLSDSVQAFSKKLAENDAEFPDDFNASIFALIRRMRPKKAAPAAAKVRSR
jgi:ATP-dependent RNA helicase DHX8/PRP22